MLGLAEDLRARGANLRVLNLGGGNVDIGTPMGSMVFTVMAALAQMDANASTIPPPNAVQRGRTSEDGANSSVTAKSAMPAVSSRQGNRPSSGYGPGHVSRATVYRRMAQLEAREWMLKR